MAKRRSAGHWCWCCGQVLANERFSGKGHTRHICKACSKLDGSEKEYRQALANLDRAYRHTYPFIHKSRRKWFDALATSPNEKIRKLHADVTARMAAEREERRRLREEDERARRPSSQTSRVWRSVASSGMLRGFLLLQRRAKQPPGGPDRP